MNVPRATVRLQLHRGFNFDDAADTVDYYARLGISHFYVSPIFTAKVGSTHGYDVIDPTRVNPELGGEAALLRLVDQLRSAGMGLVIDIVPNHMGVAPGSNQYWQNVLQWGPQSPFADWFDIDWQTATPHLQGKMLLPVLGDVYDAVLRAGDLRLAFDADLGELEVAYHDNRFPLAPASLAGILAGQPVFAETSTLFARAVPESLQNARHALAGQARTSEGRHAIDAALAPYSPASVSGQALLHGLLEKQHYRLSWWRNAAEEINWRRFFEVSDLAGVRVELEPVFEATHAAVFDLYRRGLIDGVRIDHVDGLADPAAYCRRLRARLEALRPERPAPLNSGPAWVVVEKILTPGESLAADWHVNGTTGYDFMNEVGKLLHDGAGEQKLRQFWADITGDVADFEAHVGNARRQLLSENFVGEHHALVHALHRYAHHAPLQGRDIALSAVARVVTALLAAFRRYRSYCVQSTISDEDRQVLHEAALRAKAMLHLPDHDLLDKVAGWLGLDALLDDTDAARELRERAITRFQQLTPPVAAKSVEDTAFYRHAPLFSRNDVGSYPSSVAQGAGVFHEANLRRAASFPHALLATATHDHKRGEDVRARLAVLSEIPDDWASILRRWINAHAFLRQLIAAPGGGQLTAPTAADEIMLYQTVLGAWPSGLQPADKAAVAGFAGRVAVWQEKSLREAKLHSSWLLPNQPYETACRSFLDGLLQAPGCQRFLTDIAELAARLQPATEANSLTQTLMRLTCPGVPDLYQGCEFEDSSLVDPDNRRPVDMKARRAALDGEPLQHRKQHLIRVALACRLQNPDLFAEGDYVALKVCGARQENVVAFARRAGDQIAISVALRLPYSMLNGSVDWADTRIVVPDDFPNSWRDAIGSKPWAVSRGNLQLCGMFDAWTVALLLPEPA